MTGPVFSVLTPLQEAELIHSSYEQAQGLHSGSPDECDAILGVLFVCF